MTMRSTRSHQNALEEEIPGPHGRVFLTSGQVPQQAKEVPIDNEQDRKPKKNKGSKDWWQDPLRSRCTDTNRRGVRCKKPLSPGGTVCWSHGAAAPQVRAANVRRLAKSHDSRVAEQAKAWLANLESEGT
jgi:hypothetical protein